MCLSLPLAPSKLRMSVVLTESALRAATTILPISGIASVGPLTTEDAFQADLRSNHFCSTN